MAPPDVSMSDCPAAGASVSEPPALSTTAAPFAAAETRVTSSEPAVVRETPAGACSVPAMSPGVSSPAPSESVSVIEPAAEVAEMIRLAARFRRLIPVPACSVSVSATTSTRLSPLPCWRIDPPAVTVMLPMAVSGASAARLRAVRIWAACESVAA